MLDRLGREIAVGHRVAHDGDALTGPQAQTFDALCRRRAEGEPITEQLVADAEAAGIDVEAISPGTIRNPPPIPKKPESMPVPSPNPATLGKLSRLQTTPSTPSPLRERYISTATPIISKANRNNSFWPSNALPALDPASAPNTPASA